MAARRGQACDTDSPLALALRHLQLLDGSTADLKGYRWHLIRAETLLGEQLGLQCTGAPDGWNEDGTVAYYSHDGDTCPVHEWLVQSDAAVVGQ